MDVDVSSLAVSAPDDIHDWINVTQQDEDNVFPSMSRQAREFYNRLKNISRHDFSEAFNHRFLKVKTHQEIARILCTRYEQSYFDQHHVLNQTPARLPPHTGDETSGGGATEAEIHAHVALLVGHSRHLEQERIVIDLVRSWKIYLDEWVASMRALRDLWEEIFDWYERGLYGGVINRQTGALPQPDETMALVNELRDIEVRVDFAKRGAVDKGARILAMGPAT